MHRAEEELPDVQGVAGHVRAGTIRGLHIDDEMGVMTLIGMVCREDAIVLLHVFAVGIHEKHPRHGWG